MQQRNLSSGRRREVRRKEGQPAVWQVDKSMRQKGDAQRRNWVAYPIQVQEELERLLRSAMERAQEDRLGAKIPAESNSSGRQAIPLKRLLKSVAERAQEEHLGAEVPTVPNSSVRQAMPLKCPQGHGLRIFDAHDDRYMCDACGEEQACGSTVHGCWRCDYDLCARCAEPVPLVPADALSDIVHLLEGTAPGSLEPGAARRACDAALAFGVDRATAHRLLAVLVMRHAFKCSVDDARRSALIVGSMAVLQLVVLSDPMLQFHGLELFDKKYPGHVKLADAGVKSCIKAMLARGARLGQEGIVPSSKLLRKIEADALPLWVQLFWRSVAAAGLDVPDHVQGVVEAFLLPRGRQHA